MFFSTKWSKWCQKKTVLLVPELETVWFKIKPWLMTETNDRGYGYTWLWRFCAEKRLLMFALGSWIILQPNKKWSKRTVCKCLVRSVLTSTPSDECTCVHRSAIGRVSIVLSSISNRIDQYGNPLWPERSMAKSPFLVKLSLKFIYPCFEPWSIRVSLRRRSTVFCALAGVWVVTLDLHCGHIGLLTHNWHWPQVNFLDHLVHTTAAGLRMKGEFWR